MAGDKLRVDRDDVTPGAGGTHSLDAMGCYNPTSSKVNSTGDSTADDDYVHACFYD
jgi:hypothetical protein